MPGYLGPWSSAGRADLDFDDSARASHHALLTDPNLLTCFRRRFPDHRNADYDEMVRLLGYVWDCPDDGAATMKGHCCAVCGRPLALTSVTAITAQGSPQ